ncbi:MAG: hypothetical protein GXP03_06035 [Alphaproteobacteria bacterium]|nr:hypothetical protein [Alphaproteobacteria bacterium]
MKLTKLLIPLILSLATGMAAQAGTQIKETWDAKWAGQKCTLVLSYDKAKLAGPVKVRGGCGKALRKVKSFVYTDAAHSQLILFSKKNARGAMIGSFDKAGKKSFKGMIGDGTSAKMFRTAISTVTVSVGVTASSGSTGTQDCIRYANRQKCAGAADLINPNIPTFKTIEMQALADQSIFPFSGGNGFAKDESVVKGARVVVKRCERAFNSNEDWCEMVLSDGFFTGWIKRMDTGKVYLREF